MTEKKNWYKLDNAAIIIPPSTKGASTRVFRIVCQLTERVNPEYLQNALNDVVHEFPHFNVVLRKGLFWYYLDETDKMPVVSVDDSSACGPIYVSGRKNLLYKVTYFQNRINLEMFHVLADGTGAFVFFKRLILRYLELTHALVLNSTDETSSKVEKSTDAFQKFYSKGTSRDQLNKASHTRAYQIKGIHDENMENHLVEIRLSSKKFAEVAHHFETTVGVLSVSLYLQAILHEMTVHDKKLPIVVSVPVNLRKYFPSETTRNFYGTINIEYHAENYDGTLESILPIVSKQFKDLLQPEEIRKNMNAYAALEHNFAVKVVPLFIKDLAVARIGNRSAKGVTGTISNLGRIDMPLEACPYIDYFSAFMAKQNMQITLASFNDTLTFGVCSDLKDHNLVHQLCRILTDLGMELEIATNDFDVQEAD